MSNFQETFHHLEALARLLLCSKCSEIPIGKAWTLGVCFHKYCEKCMVLQSGKPCLVCHKQGYPKDSKTDLFSSSVLLEIPEVFSTLMHVEELFCCKLANGEQQTEKDMKQNDNWEEGYESPCGNMPQGIIENSLDCVEFNDDNKMFEVGTPSGQIIESQEFPDLMEETPQNKLRTRPLTLKHASNKCDLAVTSARTLVFDLQEAEHDSSKLKESIICSNNPSPGKYAGLDDEELFTSPKECHETLEPIALPVLTPHHNDSSNSHVHPKQSRRKKSALITSGQTDPPRLTPQKSSVTKNVAVIKVPEEKHEPIKSSSLVSSKTKRSTSSAKSKKQLEIVENLSKISAIPIADCQPVKKKEVRPESERKRRSSTISAASSSLSLVCIKQEKRNAKGETCLHVACRAGNLERVGTFLKNGSDVNAKDNAGWTPIHEAINGKGAVSVKAAILRLLCEKGADVDAQGGGPETDETPLHSAVQLGQEILVEILLEFKASPNIRAANGFLPKDIASNTAILKLLEGKRGSIGTCTTGLSTDHVNANSSTFLSTTSMVEEDPAVMKVMVKKALIYFNYDEEPETVKATVEKLGLAVSEKLTAKVTHVVHLATAKQKDSSFFYVPLSICYLYGVAHCMWQVRNDWITQSIKHGECLIPTSFEISGYEQEVQTTVQDEGVKVPMLTRVNRENGNPNLLDGFSFYLYKTCGFDAPCFKITKKQLMELIVGAGGNITNREPNPDLLANDIADAPPKYHVINNSRGDNPDYITAKFTITTHIILFDEKAAPLKRFNYEHVKTLNSKWVIDSLLNFKLMDPEKYL